MGKRYNFELISMSIVFTITRQDEGIKEVNKDKYQILEVEDFIPVSLKAVPLRAETTFY